MKVYNKMGLTKGIAFFVIGIVFLISLMIDGDIKCLLAGGFAGLSRIGDISRSLRKNLFSEGIEQRSEGTKCIQQKSKEYSFIILELLMSIIFLSLVIYYVVTKQTFVIPYILIFIGLLTARNILESIFWYYFEKKN